MNTQTLLHLDYLNRVFILVNQENYGDYSLHQKIGKEIDRRVFKELDGTAKERLVAHLVTIQRYYLFLEKHETGKTEEEIKWDESYLQLTQFIESLLPGYSYRLAYLHRNSQEKEGKRWVSTYSVHVVNGNQLKEKKVAFHLIQEEEKQSIKWEMDAEHLNEHYPEFERNLEKIKEDEFLFYKQETNPNSTPLFEGFDDLLD